MNRKHLCILKKVYECWALITAISISLMFTETNEATFQSVLKNTYHTKLPVKPTTKEALKYYWLLDTEP